MCVFMFVDNGSLASVVPALCQESTNQVPSARGQSLWCICDMKYVTRFYKTDPNRTSDKIKLTPVGSYSIVLLVLTLSTTQTTRSWFQQMSFPGGGGGGGGVELE